MGKKLTQQVYCPDTERLLKVSAKSETVVSNSAYSKMVKFLRAGEKVKISNFIGWFCLKDILLEQDIDTAVSCPDTERPWTVRGKTEFWFPIQSI